MARRATAGACLASLVKMAVPLCQRAERECPRTGPGRKPEIPDWVMAVLIMVAVLKRKKTKSAQYRFLEAHRPELQAWLGTSRFPARSTYFERYRRAHRLFACAIRLQGRKALAEGVTDATAVAVDKTLIAAQGPKWHKRDRQQNRIPERLRGVDRDSDWGYSPHDGWVQGYSLETVVTATKGSLVFPLLASAARASAKEVKTFAPKIPQLPARTRYVLADSAYDSNALGEQIEWTEKGKRTGRRFLCAENRRTAKRSSCEEASPPRDRSHQRRRERQKFYRSRRGRALYRRRGHTIEPFHEWFKSLWELEERVWHRGLENIQTLFLAAIFVYQLLVRYHCRRGPKNGCVRPILDKL